MGGSYYESQEVFNLMVDLKVAPATIYGLIDDYNNLGANASLTDRTAYALKVYKAVEPMLQSIPGWGKVSISAGLALNDYNTLSAKINANTAKTTDYLTLVSSTTNLLGDLTSLSKTPQGQGASLLLKIVSGGFSYGAIFTSGGALDWQTELVNLYIAGDEASSGSALNGPGYNFTIDPGWLNYDQITNNYLDNTAKALQNKPVITVIKEQERLCGGVLLFSYSDPGLS